MRTAMVRAAVGLGLFAMVTAGVVAFTRAWTEERIAENRLADRHRLLGEVLPSDLQGIPIQSLLDQTLQLPPNDSLGHSAPFDAWHITNNDQEALILPVTAKDGYNGDIDLLIGITGRGTISGVRVTQHQETPGLGDKIEHGKSDWIDTFDGRSLDDPPPDEWGVAPDGGAFDAFTGATITPRAVVKAVHHTLVFADEESERWQHKGQDNNR
ncbi:electron transport complex subunit RsxG [Aidingimonas halophila]|nr:electron transport complex subunit RsxG [Aidingimonas halophila]